SRQHWPAWHSKLAPPPLNYAICSGVGRVGARRANRQCKTVLVPDRSRSVLAHSPLTRAVRCVQPEVYPFVVPNHLQSKRKRVFLPVSCRAVCLGGWAGPRWSATTITASHSAQRFRQSNLGDWSTSMNSIPTT